MSNDIVVITGGGSGMGQLAARNHAALGHQVAILDVNEIGMQKTAEGFDNIECHTVDVTSVEAVREVFELICAGERGISRFYNCAAIMPLGKILEQDVEVMQRIVDIDVMGFIIPSKEVLAIMVKQGYGEFVGFSSVAGLMPSLKTGIYSAAKAAVAIFMETMWHENRNSGVKFRCVCPPLVDTPLLEQGRATEWAKAFDAAGSAIQPQEVLDAIDQSLAKEDEFWVFPNRQARFTALFRRLFPSLLWRSLHKIEGE